MPVTKTAKRALRVSKRKTLINQKIKSSIDIAIRAAKKDKKETSINKAISLVDRAAKKGIYHKNKASRIKSRLAKLATATKTTKKAKK